MVEERPRRVRGVLHFEQRVAPVGPVVARPEVPVASVARGAQEKEQVHCVARAPQEVLRPAPAHARVPAHRRPGVPAVHPRPESVAVKPAVERERQRLLLAP